MKSFTYLIYIILWEGLIVGGTMYAVFVLNHSAWWSVFAFLMSANAYSPEKWIYGETKKEKINE